MAQAGEAADHLGQRPSGHFGEREVLEARVTVSERALERLAALPAERSAQPAELRERRQVELPADCGDAEDERTQLREPRNRVEWRSAVGAKVEVAHVGQLLEQGEVTKVETKSDGL